MGRRDITKVRKTEAVYPHRSQSQRSEKTAIIDWAPGGILTCTHCGLNFDIEGFYYQHIAESDKCATWIKNNSGSRPRIRHRCRWCKKLKPVKFREGPYGSTWFACATCEEEIAAENRRRCIVCYKVGCHGECGEGWFS